MPIVAVTVLWSLACTSADPAPGPALAPAPDDAPVVTPAPHPKGYGPLSPVFPDVPDQAPRGAAFDTSRQLQTDPHGLTATASDLDSDGRSDWFLATTSCGAMGCMGAAYIPTTSGWCYAGTGFEVLVGYEGERRGGLTCLDTWSMVDGLDHDFPTLTQATAPTHTRLAGALPASGTAAHQELFAECYALDGATLHVLHGDTLTLATGAAGAPCATPGPLLHAPGGYDVSVLGTAGDLVLAYAHTELYNHAVWLDPMTGAATSWGLWGDDALRVQGQTVTVTGIGGATCDTSGPASDAWRAGCVQAFVDQGLPTGADPASALLQTADVSALSLRCTDPDRTRFGQQDEVFLVATATLDFAASTATVSDLHCTYGPS